MTLRSTLFVILLLLIARGQVQAQSEIITLEQAIQIALANAPDIKIGILEVARADKDVESAWAEVFPSISGSFNYQRNREVPVSFLPAIFFNPNASADELIPVQFGTDNNWQTGFTVDQTLFRGEALVGIASATVYKLVQEESLRATAQQVVTTTRLAYYNVLLAKEQLGVQDDNVKRLRENLEDNRKRYEAGLLDEFQVLQLEVELKNEEPLLVQAEDGLSEAFRSLRISMGMPSGFQFQVIGDLLAFELGTDPDPENEALAKIDQRTQFEVISFGNSDDYSIDFSPRGDLRVLSAQTQLKEKEVFAYKSRFLPEFSASYNYQWSAVQPGAPDFNAIMSPNDQRARSQVIGISARMTFFDGLRRKATVQKAQIELKQLDERRTYSIQTAENQIEKAVEDVQQAVMLLPAYDEALEVAQRGYDIALSRYSKGFGTQIDVLNAQLALRRAQLNRAQGMFTYLSSKASYDQAIGRVPFVEDTFNP